MLSLTGKRWNLPAEHASVNASHVLARLLSARGIDPDAPLTLVSPSVFPDMQRATERIETAIKNHERIGIFGDYDCDGVTAVCQLTRFFARRGIIPWVRLPHRVHDGYGLQKGVVREILDAGITLLITADTGIASVREIAALRKGGVDTIVTDHHHLSEELPRAYAILHPALCAYPEPHPSGAGVVYKLIHALEGAPWDDIESDTALAMIGTVADLVPLRGDNRALVTLGLKAFARAGGAIGALRERCSSNGRLMSATDIAFRVAPRINAAGRVDDPLVALRALTEGGESLSALDTLNEQRQNLTRNLMEHALAAVAEDTALPVLAVADESYPPGIVGLLAGRLCEQFGKPALAAHIHGAMCTASLRSPPCYNIVEGLSRCKRFLKSFGGHAQAAGCTFAMKDMVSLKDALCADVRGHVDAELLVPSMTIDAVLHVGDITTQFAEQLLTLAPFGQANPEPLFLLRGVHMESRPCGHGNTHVHGKISGVKFVGFNLGNFAGESRKLDVVARLEINEWNGKRVPQLLIEDMMLHTQYLILNT